LDAKPGGAITTLMVPSPGVSQFTVGAIFLGQLADLRLVAPGT